MMYASDPNGPDHSCYSMTGEYILLSIPYECELFRILFRLYRKRKGAFTT